MIYRIPAAHSVITSFFPLLLLEQWTHKLVLLDLTVLLGFSIFKRIGGSFLSVFQPSHRSLAASLLGRYVETCNSYEASQSCQSLQLWGLASSFGSLDPSCFVMFVELQCVPKIHSSSPEKKSVAASLFHCSFFAKVVFTFSYNANFPNVLFPSSRSVFFHLLTPFQVAYQK